MEIDKIKEETLVSVIVPCYNHARYITECIESILSQTYKNIELIVIDDGSKDSCPRLLRELQAKHGFTLIIQENHGIAFTLNKGLKEYSHGKYFSICASDDYWIPTKIEKQVDFMQLNFSYPMCYGKTHYVTENSEIIEEYDHLNNNLKGGDIFDDVFIFRFHLPVNYLFNTEILLNIGGYDEKFCAEDYYQNLNISSKYPIGFLNEYLGFYRLTETAAKIERFEKISDSHLLAIEQFKTHPLYSLARRMVFLRKFDMYSGSAKHKKKAVTNLLKSFRFCYKLKFISACIKLLVLWKN